MVDEKKNPFFLGNNNLNVSLCYGVFHSLYTSKYVNSNRGVKVYVCVKFCKGVGIFRVIPLDSVLTTGMKSKNMWSWLAADLSVASSSRLH